MEEGKLNKEKGSERNILLWMIIIICLCIASSVVLQANKTERAIEKLDIVQKDLSQLEENFDEAINRAEESYKRMGNAMGNRVEDYFNEVDDRLDDIPDRIGERTAKRIHKSLDRIEKNLRILRRKLNIYR